jgi:ascorbate-specific PTS system EIIC-type component UlaA
MRSLLAAIDRLTGAVGRAVTWCLVGMVVVQVTVVLMRYVLGLGSIWLSETILYAHAAVAPPLLRLPGVDPIWLGILMAVRSASSRLC